MRRGVLCWDGGVQCDGAKTNGGTQCHASASYQTSGPRPATHPENMLSNVSTAVRCDGAVCRGASRLLVGGWFTVFPCRPTTTRLIGRESGSSWVSKKRCSIYGTTCKRAGPFVESPRDIERRDLGFSYRMRSDRQSNTDYLACRSARTDVPLPHHAPWTAQKRHATFRWRSAPGRDSAPHRIVALLRAAMDHDLEEVRVSRYQQGSDGLGMLSRLLIFDQAVVLIGDPVLEIQQGAIRLILIASPYPLA
jgi:hypothetical protein